MKVKLILPALTEAKSPFFRPIKYSLFPPLGLATLAAHLAPDDDAILVDEHVEEIALDDAPDLVVIQCYPMTFPARVHAWHGHALSQHERVTAAIRCWLSRLYSRDV